MRAALESTALLLILALCLLADGIMDSFGHGTFAAVSAATLAAAELLRTAAGQKKKGPLCSRRPKQSTRDHLTRPQGGRIFTLYHGPRQKIKEDIQKCNYSIASR